MSVDVAPVSPASPWMRHLERAHDRAHAAARAIELETEPSAHLAPAARKLELGIAALYDAFDGRADRPTAIGAAHARLWDAAVLAARAGLPGAVAALREACAELVRAEVRMPRVPLEGPKEARLQAGVDTPPLHVIERASLAPSFRAPPVPESEEATPAVALPDPTTFEELVKVAEEARSAARARAEALVQRMNADEGPKAIPAPEPIPAGFAYAPPAAMTDDAFVARWARECFEEIGMIGLQRAPLPGDEWRSCKSLEARMIAAIDAIAALGPAALARVEALAMDMPAANPMSVFAVAMIGGCVEGRDALAGAERVLHRFGPLDPMVGPPFAAAMKLAPSPYVESATRSLLASKEIGCRAIAVDVLAHRGWLTAEDLSVIADDPDPRVLALGLPAMAAARHPDLDRALDRALGGSDARLRIAALDAMAIAALGRAAPAARREVEGPLGDRALVRLAIVAGEDDARFVLDRARAAKTADATVALGWAGLVEAVPLLLDLLESKDDEVKLAAGAALDRLLGARLVESLQILPEALEEVQVVDPDPEPPPARPTLAALVSHPRDVPPKGSSETLEVPSTDPAVWRAYWKEHGPRLDPRMRIRRGQGWSPSVSLYELDRLSLSPDERRCLHRELAARTGKLTPFDPHDFVSVQEQSLAAWAALIRATPETPGSWSRPLR